MKLLTVVVCSHERPRYLAQMLSSIVWLNTNPDCSVVVSDNSILHATQIRQICQDLEFDLKTTLGGTQASNFLRFTELPRTKYLMILHDDDIVYVQNSSRFFSALDSENQDLLYIESFACHEEMPCRIRDYEMPGVKEDESLALYLFPYQLPSFPAMIYRRTTYFDMIMKYACESRPCGKYSDSWMLVFLSDLRKSRPILAPGIGLMLRWHAESDVYSYDLFQHLRLLLFTCSRLDSITSQCGACADFLGNLSRQIAKNALARIRHLWLQ
jgi:hypothetical protein